MKATTAKAARFIARIHRTSLQLKITALGAVVTAGILALAFWALSLDARASMRIRVAEQLGPQGALLQLQRQNQAQLRSSAAIITQSPNLRAALATSHVEANLGGTRADLVQTIENELAKLLERVQGDLLFVTDDSGRVFAAAMRGGRLARRGEDLSAMPAVRQALDPSTSADSGQLAVYRDRETSYQAAVYPLVQGDYTMGTLVLAERLETGLVASARAAFDGQVVVTAGRSIIAGTIKSARPGLAQNLLASKQSRDKPPVVSLSGEEHLVAGWPLGETQGGETVSLWLMQPLDRSVSAFTGPLLRSFVFYGVLAVAIAALGSGLVTHSVLRPFRRFVTHMGSAATSDRPEDGFDARNVPAEVRELHQSLEQLMGSISGKQLALEQRTTELIAANAVLVDEVRERQRVERDLHERDAQLRQAHKLEAIGTLAGGIAHDFNNVLTAISGFTHLALAEVNPDSGMAADLRQVVKATDHASDLTKQLLAFSKKQVLESSLVVVVDVIHDLAPLLDRLLGDDITLRMMLDDNVSRVMSDRGQLEQLIMNLAINARDAMPVGGVLTISAGNVQPDRRANEVVPIHARVLITVSDTGTGIPEDIRERIFEPFFTTKGTGKGTGLGLSTVYGIVNQWGGTIRVASTVGVGTTFSITLPAASATALSSAADTAQGVQVQSVAAKLPGGTETVLLVEDQQAVRDFCRRTLEGLGYTVLPASDGIDGLRVAASTPIDLILSDVMMPRMGGPELVQQFLLVHPAPVVMFMSGYAEEALMAEVRLISSAVLRKPFSPAILARAVRDALDASRTSKLAVAV